MPRRAGERRIGRGRCTRRWPGRPDRRLRADAASVSAARTRNPDDRRNPNTRLGITSDIGYPNEGGGNAVRISADLSPPNPWGQICTLMQGPGSSTEITGMSRSTSPARFFSACA